MFFCRSEQEKNAESVKSEAELLNELSMVCGMPNKIYDGAAVVEKASEKGGFDIVGEKGQVLCFLSEKCARNAAYWLKPRLMRDGFYNFKLNEDALKTRCFSTYFVFKVYGCIDTLEKALRYWKRLAELVQKKTGVFVQACFYSDSMGIRVFGCMNSEIGDVDAWENAVMQIFAASENLAYPKFTEL